MVRIVYLPVKIIYHLKIIEHLDIPYVPYVGPAGRYVDVVVPKVSSTTQQQVYYVLFYKCSTFNTIQLGLSQTLIN